MTAPDLPPSSGPDGPPPPVERAPGLGGLLQRLPLPFRIGVPVVVVALVVGAVLLLQRPADTGTETFTTLEDEQPVRVAGAGEFGPLDVRTPAKGEAAPDFRLPGPDGAPVRLSDLRGTPVLVNFWATWCAPCKAEMPALQQAYEAAGGAFVILAVNVESTSPELARSRSLAFRDEYGLTFPFVFDSPAADVFRQYRLRGLPSTFFIDRDGMVRDMVIGPLSENALEKKLEAIAGK